MAEFFGSLSLGGWVIVVIAGLTLWQLPAVLGMVWEMLTTGRRPRPYDGERRLRQLGDAEGRRPDDHSGQ